MNVNFKAVINRYGRMGLVLFYFLEKCLCVGQNFPFQIRATAPPLDRSSVSHKLSATEIFWNINNSAKPF